MKKTIVILLVILSMGTILFAEAQIVYAAEDKQSEFEKICSAPSFPKPYMCIKPVIKTCKAPTASERHQCIAQIIVKNYDTDNNGTIDREELRGYLNAEAFDKIDRYGDKNNALNKDECFTEKFYCRPVNGGMWECNDEEGHCSDKIGSEGNKDSYIALTPEDLYKSRNMWWKYSINARLDAQWNRAMKDCSGSGCGSLGVDALASHMEEEAKRRKNVNTPQSRIKKLKGIVAGNTTVTYDEFRKLIYFEEFDSSDSDMSRTLDISEFIKAFSDQGGTVKDFVDIANNNKPANFQIQRNQFQQTIQSVISYGKFGSELDKKAYNEWNSLTYKDKDNDDDITLVSGLIRNINEEEQSAIEERKKKKGVTVFGRTWLKKRGLLLTGKPLTNKKGTPVALDLSNGAEPTWTLRLIQDFTKADSEAKPAQFNWSKAAGEESEASILAVLRFDYFNPTWFDSKRFHPAFGVEFNRSKTSKKKVYTQKYYVLADWFVTHKSCIFSILCESGFQVGPVYENDLENDIEKLTGLIEWELGLNIGKFSTGVRHAIDRGTASESSIYVRPRLALEINEIINEPKGADTSDSSFFRYGLEIGYKFTNRLTLIYNYKQWHATDDSDEDYSFKDASLQLKLDPHGMSTIKAGYKKGEASPKFEEVEKYEVGLGIRF